MNDSTTPPASASTTGSAPIDWPALPTPLPPTGSPRPSWPCPQWCQHPQGHLFEQAPPDDLTRFHEQRIVYFKPAGADPHDCVEVTLSQEEVVVAGGAGGRALSEPWLYVVCDDLRLNAEEARAFAQGLLQGVAALERITSQVSS